LATKPEGTHRGGVIWGRNIKSASSELTERGRYSAVKVRGQTTVGSGKQQLRAQTTARDSSVTRERPLVVIHEGETTLDRLQTRAEWQAKRGAGEASTATVTVFGWRDAEGRIWNRNWLVYVQDEWIAIDGMMIIKTVSLSQDGLSEGTTATLTLSDPRALGGENPRGKTSGTYAAPGAITVEYEDE
jgi:prophage tail gpP-like protein